MSEQQLLPVITDGVFHSRQFGFTGHWSPRPGVSTAPAGRTQTALLSVDDAAAYRNSQGLWPYQPEG